MNSSQQTGTVVSLPQIEKLCWQETEEQECGRNSEESIQNYFKGEGFFKDIKKIGVKVIHS